MKHELKCRKDYFQAIWVGDKTFEIRKNDRGFKERDEIVLLEYDPYDNLPPDMAYTGRKIEGFIRYITDFEQKDGYVVFSFQEDHREEE